MFKNILKILLVVLLSLHTGTVISQLNRGDYKNQLKVSPFRLIDPVHSDIE